MYEHSRARVFLGTNEITRCFWKSFVKEISAICAGCNRRLEIAEMLNLFESSRWYFMKDLIYTSNICTLLTTNKSSGILHTAQCKNERHEG